MSNKYSEVDITWSSIEKYIPYSKVVWSTGKDGIPVYMFMDKKSNKLNINWEKCLNSKI